MNSAAKTPLTAPSYSIERRLSSRLALQIAIVLAIMSVLIYCTAHMLMSRKQDTEHTKKIAVVSDIMREASAEGGFAQLARTAELMATRRPGTRLEITRPNGEVLYRDPNEGPFMLSKHTRTKAFSVDLTRENIGVLNGQFTIDVEYDEHLMDDLFWALVFVPILGGALVWLSTAWRVRRELRPLHTLAQQTKRITPQRLNERLKLPEVAEELAPWVNQFNELMDRLQGAIVQLEAFNADVAHELRTPLAALMGNTEVALAKNRSSHELKETMIVSLEQLRQLSSMINDMLFLSGADRGALARRGEPTRLCGIAKSVVEFHEFALEEAGLTAEVHGSAVASVDAPLLQRALSNLIGNATRFAERGSAVRVLIEEASDREIHVAVENRGEAIEPTTLPRLFDRFYRGDDARCDSENHHGLGLAIVSAIARMHGGRPLASCANGVTRIGLTLRA
jgi:two-component system, OmpR family, heavy metal sensor histidine kinase CusS